MNNINIDKLLPILIEHVKQYKLPVLDDLASTNHDPFRILVAALLSARTNDKTTANAIYRLFNEIGKIDDLSKLSILDIEKLIYPVGFYHQKAKYLKTLPVVLKERFNNEIPQSIEQLVTLPGVGRKTANLIMILAFDKPAICVDVHVHRICNRIGYVSTRTPEETEFKLRDILPKKYWKKVNKILVTHGQNTCKPINPLCTKCPINHLCKYDKKVK